MILTQKTILVYFLFWWNTTYSLILVNYGDHCIYYTTFNFKLIFLRNVSHILWNELEDFALINIQQKKNDETKNGRVFIAKQILIVFFKILKALVWNSNRSLKLPQFAKLWCASLLNSIFTIRNLSLFSFKRIKLLEFNIIFNVLSSLKHSLFVDSFSSKHDR